jgi:hypothetical protein
MKIFLLKNFSIIFFSAILSIDRKKIYRILILGDYMRSHILLRDIIMKNDRLPLLENRHCIQRRSWCHFSLKKNIIKRFSFLDYCFCLFNISIEKLELPKLDVDSCEYDPVYEKTVRQQNAKILYMIDDVLVDLAEKHFDVALSAFALEAVLLSPHFHQKMAFDENGLDVTPYVEAILKALYQSAQLLSLIQNPSNETRVRDTLGDVGALLNSYPWQTLEKSQEILLLRK